MAVTGGASARWSFWRKWRCLGHLSTGGNHRSSRFGRISRHDLTRCGNTGQRHSSRLRSRCGNTGQRDISRLCTRCGNTGQRDISRLRSEYDGTRRSTERAGGSNGQRQSVAWARHDTGTNCSPDAGADFAENARADVAQYCTERSTDIATGKFGPIASAVWFDVREFCCQLACEYQCVTHRVYE